MKINVLQPLKDYEGNPLLDKNTKKPVLLRDIIVRALNHTLNGEKPGSAEEKTKLYQLSVKVQTTKEVDLTAEEISKIKANTAELFSPLIAGQTCLILEGKE